MNIRLLSTCVFLVLAGAFLAGPALAGLYKYVDENGNVTYSQTPPPSGEYEYLKTPKTPKGSGSTSSKASKKSSAKRSIQADAEASSTAADIEQNIANAEQTRQQKCAEAQKALETYTVYRRFRGKDGEVFYMDENERQARLNDARQGIEEFCD